MPERGGDRAGLFRMRAADGYVRDLFWRRGNQMTTVGRVDALLGEVRGVLELTRDRGRLAPVPAAGLAAALMTLDNLADQLERLQTMVVLEQYSPDDDGMGQAHAQWLMVEPGRDVRDIAHLVSTSPTLSTLNKVAVSFDSVYRYDDAHVELASQIGEWCGDFPQYVGMLANDRHAEFGVTSDAVDGLERLLKRLTKIGAIEGFELQGKVRPKGRKPFWRNREACRDWKLDQWRVRRGTVLGDYGPFLRGHWLTAYAYGIALDQFTRAGAPFEIYSNVQYHLPHDLGGGKSDIDVLVRTADLLLCVECKSGKVLTSFKPDQPPAAVKALRAAERIERLLDTMGISLQRHYQLLFLPSLAQPQEEVVTVTSVGDVPMLVSNPTEVRALVQRIALRQPMGLIAKS